MRLTNAAKDYFRIFKSVKYRILIPISVMCIFVVITAQVLAMDVPKGIRYSVFDIMMPITGRTGILGVLSLVFPIVPTFVFVLMKLVDLEDGINCLVRQRSREGIWRKQTGIIIVLSVLFCLLLILGGYVLSGVLVGTFNNNWSSNQSYVYSLFGQEKQWDQISKTFITYKMLFFLTINYFVGFCAIGFLICTLKIVLKNIYVYILTMILLLMDGMLDKFSLVLKQMIIQINNWANPRTIIINELYLLLFSIALFVVGKELIRRKDFINNM